MFVAPSPRLRLAAVACLAALGLSACAALASVPVGPSQLTPPPPAAVAQQTLAVCQAVALGGPTIPGKLVQGLTHTQYRADSAGDPQAVNRALAALAAASACRTSS